MQTPQSHPIKIVSPPPLRVAGENAQLQEPESARPEGSGRAERNLPVDPVGCRIAGLAHDLRNLLTIGLTNTVAARQASDAEAAVESYLSATETALRRAGELVQAMSDLAQHGDYARGSVTINDVVREAIHLLRSSVLAAHDVRFELPSSVPAVPAVPVQIRRVVFNLLLNAAEACDPAGGRIRISTTSVQLGQRQVDNLLPSCRRAPGNYVRLRVVDNGCGMGECVRAKLFSKIVSTKGDDRGNGLATVGQVVRDHAGGIRLMSELGRGTVFDVFFPLPHAGRAPARGQPDERGSKRGKLKEPLAGTILVADDTDVLRSALSEFLSLVGYRVRLAANGEEALGVLKGHPEVDLVLLDVNMPGLDGFETFEAIRAMRGAIPVVLMSGDLDQSVRRQFSDLAPAAFLEKPFSLVALKEALGRLVTA